MWKYYDPSFESSEDAHEINLVGSGITHEIAAHVAAEQDYNEYSSEADGRDHHMIIVSPSGEEKTFLVSHVRPWSTIAALKRSG